MATLRRFPFMLASDNNVAVTRWSWLNGNNEWAELPRELPDWDPATPVSIKAVVQLDPLGVRSDCRLSADSGVRVAMVWQCPGTGLRGCGTVEDVDLRGSRRELALGVYLEGRNLADRVTIGVNLILARSGKAPRQLAAKRPGNVLWVQERAVTLEGMVARFPTELKDFSRGGWLQPKAAWYLDWSPEDLHQLVLADLRLFVNSALGAVREAVAGAGEDEKHRALREMIRYDVARTLIEGALESEVFVEAPMAYEDGTVGAAVRRLIATLFGGQEVASLAEYYRRNRFRFEMQLQDRLELFKGL